MRNSSKSISPGCVGVRIVGTRIISYLPNLSMIINDFNLVGGRVYPVKTYSIRVIDPYTMLTNPLAGKFIQPVSGWNAKLRQPFYRSSS